MDAEFCEVMDAIASYLNGPEEELLGKIERIRARLHQISPQRESPVDRVRWVPLGSVVANDYNPNSVPQREMSLLYHSIKADGYTQPIVCVHDKERDRYVIVDGFHRYTTMKRNADIRERCNGMLPVVVIDKPMAERMASTVRHNRARGKHSQQGMGSMVKDMLDLGMDDAEICAELGMEAEELARLKYIEGFAKLFESAEYRKAWETRRMIRLRVAADKGAKNG